MKFLVLVAVGLATSAALPLDEAAAPVLKSSYDISPEGAFGFAYETGNGITAHAEGALKNVNGEYPAVAINGAYKYTAPDGQVVETSYVADENGFKAIGSHIPVAPEAPEYVARALAYIAAHPPPVSRL